MPAGTKLLFFAIFCCGIASSSAHAQGYPLPSADGEIDWQLLDDMWHHGLTSADSEHLYDQPDEGAGHGCTPAGLLGCIAGTLGSAYLDGVCFLWEDDRTWSPIIARECAKEYDMSPFISVPMTVLIDTVHIPCVAVAAAAGTCSEVVCCIAGKGWIW